MFEYMVQPEIVNVNKMDRELRTTLTLAALYIGFVREEAGLKLVFSEEPSQVQLAALEAYLAAFDESDPLGQERDQRAQRKNHGAELFDLLTARINIDAPVFPTIDAWLAAYQQVQFFRTLVMDGFFEFALRYFSKTVIPLAIFTPDQVAVAKELLRVYAMKYGSSSETLDAIETAEAI